MSKTGLHREGPRDGAAATRWPVVALALAVPLWLGACSGLFFDDEDLQPERVTSQPIADSSPPNLASVPEEPPLPSPQVERVEIVEGLVADRSNARYTSGATVVESQDVVAYNAGQALAPPPPNLNPTSSDTSSVSSSRSTTSPSTSRTVPRTGASSSGSTPAVPPPPSPAAGSSGSTTVMTPVQPIMPDVPELPDDIVFEQPAQLLQQQAYREQALQQRQIQELIREREIFNQQARLLALQQQAERDLALQQQAYVNQQLRYQRLAGLPPVMPVVPQAAPVQPAYPQVAGLPTASAAQGQLVGLIYFGHGSTQLDQRDQQVLRQIAALQTQQGRSLTVIGHASSRTGVVDPEQHQEANYDISFKRAKRVADALVNLGARQDLIQIVAMSDQSPVYHEFMPTGEAGNRRVEIFLN